MNSKLMKASLAGAAAIALAAGGGTFAAWSDFNVGTSGVGAGILKLDPITVGQGTGLQVQPFSLAPGQNKSQYFYLASADGDNVPLGNLTLNFQHIVDTEDGGPGCTTNSEAIAEAPADVDPVTGMPTNPANDCGTVGELASHLDTSVSASAPVSTPSACDTSIPLSLVTSGKLTALAAGSPIPVGTNLAAGQGVCVKVEMALNKVHTGDDVQGDQTSYDYKFALSQI